MIEERMTKGAQAYMGLDAFMENFADYGGGEDPYKDFSRFFLLHRRFYRVALFVLGSDSSLLNKRELDKYKLEVQKEQIKIAQFLLKLKNGEINENSMAKFIRYTAKCAYYIMSDWTLDKGKIQYNPD